MTQPSDPAADKGPTAPPVAKRSPHSYTHHGITVEDPYHWLKDEGYPDVTDPEVLDYLSAENAYFEAVMAPHQGLIDELFEEIKNRQPPEDASVPYRDGGYWYQWRFEKDAQYRIWLRAAVLPDDGEFPTIAEERWQIMLNEPELAAEHEYFTLGGLSVSRNGRYLAWSADTSGAEFDWIRALQQSCSRPYPLLAEASRMAVRVVRVVINSGSTRSSSRAIRPDFCARSNAPSKSSVRSTASA